MSFHRYGEVFWCQFIRKKKKKVTIQDRKSERPGNPISSFVVSVDKLASVEVLTGLRVTVVGPESPSFLMKLGGREIGIISLTK